MGQRTDADATPPRQRLEVRLFGGLDIRVDGERLPPLDSARARSLVAYLVLHPGTPQRRERLAPLLWPDSTDAQARTNLRKALHAVRRAWPELDGALAVAAGTMQWQGGPDVWVDVAAFDDCLAAADAPGAGRRDTADALQRAFVVGGGELLEDCYDEWALVERERARERMCSALRRLAGLRLELGEAPAAAAAARELLRMDVLDEDGCRLLMRAHEADGDRAAAVRAYHEHVATLRRELGVEPSPATTEVYDALVRIDGDVEDAARAPDHRAADRVAGGRDGELSSPGAGTARLPLPSVRPATLVGRAPEWAALTGWWRQAEDGHARLAVVTGEPGVGKTRLVEELAAWCARRGALVVQARSYPGEGELGFGLVTSWLRTEPLVTRAHRAGPTDRRDLARLLPELGQPEDPAPDIVEEPERRRRLFDAVVRTLADPDRPVLLVADDAQWSDTQSLQLAHFLLRQDGLGQLLVVATARREDLDRGHALVALVDGLQVIERAAELPLERLSRADSETLARQLTGGVLPTEVADALYADSEGNPLFIVETIRGGGDGLGRRGSELTPKLHAVIGARLAQLSDAGRDVLGIAAVIGRAFNAELLRAVGLLDEATLVAGLDELWRRGVIREHGADAYDFSHGKLREVAVDDLSPANRRRLHLLVAEALLRAHERDPEPVSAQLAGHFEDAGRVTDALTWYHRAHLEARRLQANDEAVRLLERAGLLAAGLADEGQRLRAELDVLTALPLPLAELEGWASSRLAQSQARTRDVARAVGVELPAEVVRSMVMSSLCRDDFLGARAAAAEVGRLADAAGDDGLGIEGEYLQGIGAFWGGALGDARAHFERAVAGFDAARRSEHLVRFGHDPAVVCLSRLANTWWFLGETALARDTRAGALALATDVGHPFSRGVTRVFAALLAVDLGELDEVRVHVAALQAERAHARPNGIKAEGLAGLVDVLDGRAAEGLARMRAALDRCAGTNPAPGFQVSLLRLLAAAHHAAADPHGGLGAVDELLASGGTRLWDGEARRLRATFLAATGAPRAMVDAELVTGLAVARQQGAAGIERRLAQTRADLLPPP